MSKKPPQSPISRGQVITQVATRVASKKITSGVKSVFLNENEKNDLKSKTRQEIAELIFDGLSKLRGTALKLAQLFCAETGILPDEYMKVFDQSQYRVSPLSASLVRSVIRRELGQDPYFLFAEFDGQALAAASLGQVHRARLKTGEIAAVKVQYPGINEGILSDFSMARLVLKPFGQTGLMIKILDELEERLRQEVDYHVEIQNLKWFKAQSWPPQIYIPAVFADHSSSTVMSMEFIEGVHIDQWLNHNPSQEQRDQVANSLFLFFVQSCFQHQRLHADPNLGNFLIQKDGTIAVVDFGAVKTLSHDEIHFYRLLWTAQSAEDRNGLLREYEQRGALLAKGGLEENLDLFSQAIAPYLDWIQQFLNAKQFDFKDHPNFVKQGHELFARQVFNPNLQDFDSGLTLVHRTLLGLCTIFQRLDACVEIEKARPLWTSNRPTA